jgi:hypothetical protein
VSTSKSLPIQHFRYPYAEFAEHVRAMRTVRQWEYTWRFGHLGSAQTSRAHSARVLEYFSDCYKDQLEAVFKAELLLCICDYIGRHRPFFASKQMVEAEGGSLFSVDSGLLRAVHHLFTTSAQPSAVDPKKVLALAKAFNDIDPQA